MAQRKLRRGRGRGSDTPQPEDLLSTDAGLLRGFRRGDRAALRTVFRHYAPDIARTVRAGVLVNVDGRSVRLGTDLDQHDLENLVQETFVRAFRDESRAAYDGVRSYGAYLATIARNLVIDLGRARRRESTIIAPIDFDAAASVSGEGEAVSETMEGAELERALREFLAGRTEEERRIFQLRYDEGLSLRRAAKELDTGLFRLRQADIRLRMELLSHLRDRGFLEEHDVTIGTSAVDRDRDKHTLASSDRRGALESKDD